MVNYSEMGHQLCSFSKAGGSFFPLTGFDPVIYSIIMPSKNAIREYQENGIYHIYNRGVEKRNIFLDDQDYRVFLHLLKYFLSPDTNLNQHPLTSLTGFDPVRFRPFENLSKEINLLAYCLMPNHFHLLIRQLSLYGISKLTKRVFVTYSMYFNRRYKRVGHLFQGIFKAVLIKDDSYLLHLSRYVHLNPRELTGFDPVTYPYSSYQYYLGNKQAEWIYPQLVLDYFQPSKLLIPKNINTYKNFVEDYLGDSAEILGSLTLEDPAINEDD